MSVEKNLYTKSYKLMELLLLYITSDKSVNLFITVIKKKKANKQK